MTLLSYLDFYTDVFLWLVGGTIDLQMMDLSRLQNGLSLVKNMNFSRLAISKLKGRVEKLFPLGHRCSEGAF